MNYSKIKIFTDGASRGNPGEAGGGVVITDENGRTIVEQSCYLGCKTNNAAEYLAFIQGLKQGLAIGAVEASVYLDSELVVKQMKGKYKVRNEGLKPLYETALEFSRKFKRFTISHIPREENKGADKLANRAIEMHSC